MNKEQYNQVVTILEDYSSNYGEALIAKLEKLPQGNSEEDRRQVAADLKLILEEFKSSLVELFGKIAKTGAEMEYLDDLISHVEGFVNIVYSICRKDYISANLFGVDIQPYTICAEQYRKIQKD